MTHSHLTHWIKRLKLGGVFNPHQELRILMGGVLNQSYESLFLNQDTCILTPAHITQLNEYVERRVAHEPLSKIMESREFRGLVFKTTRDTLDPRPESELLVDVILQEYASYDSKYRILDLGTGTGCILISLLHYDPHAYGMGVDISHAALHVAEVNGRNHCVNNRCEWIHSNWLQSIAILPRFDGIVANPPYIRREEALPIETTYDPPLALFGGVDGLDAYRIILATASQYLTQNGMIYLEIGYDQKESVLAIAKRHHWTLTRCIRDYQNFDRVLLLKPN